MSIIDSVAKEPFGSRLRRHWADLLTLAWPVVLSRAGILMLSLADFTMVGRHNTEELAWLAMGYAVAIPVMLVGIGGCVGIVAESSRHTGAGNHAEAAATFRRGISFATVLAIFVSVPILFAPGILLWIGQDETLAARGGAIAQNLVGASILQILFVAMAFYLEGTKRMVPGLVAMALANAVNIGLNWMLISGNWGAPELGADGAVIGSVVARVVMCVVLLGVILRLPHIRALPRSGFWGPGGWAAGRPLRVIGLASAVAYFFETLGFAVLTQVAGLISPQALAAYSIGHQIEATIFMVALGFAVATAVRVGSARGAQQREEARFAGWSGLAATMLAIAVCNILLLSNVQSIAGIFSNDTAMIQRISPLFFILAFSLFFDGAQVVLAQCTRALGDSWITTLSLFVGFWLVMTPFGIYLGLHTDFREAGLFIATALGCITATVLLVFRFRVLVARLPDQ